MSYNVFPLGRRAADGPAAQGARRPADVVDLATRGGGPGGHPPMPETVWDEIDAADRHWQALADEGREVRFDQPPDGGRVRATLREVRSGAERALPLIELFGPRDDGPPAAA
jgi:hypothetical protein